MILSLQVLSLPQNLFIDFFHNSHLFLALLDSSKRSNCLVWNMSQSNPNISSNSLKFANMFYRFKAYLPLCLNCSSVDEFNLFCIHYRVFKHRIQQLSD